MIQWRLKREDRLKIRYIRNMGVGLLLLFDLTYLIFNYTEGVVAFHESHDTDQTMFVQIIASPSAPAITPSNGEEHPAISGMGEVIFLDTGNSKESPERKD